MPRIVTSLLQLQPMSSSASNAAADFEAIRTILEANAEKARLYKEYDSPIQRRKVHLAEVARGMYKVYAFKDQLLLPENKAFCESIFDMRTLHHEIYNPNKTSPFQYPDEYESLAFLTHWIQEERKKKKAAAEAESDDDLEIFLGSDNIPRTTTTPSDDKMVVDDEAKAPAEPGVLPKGLSFKKTKPEKAASVAKAEKAVPVAGPSGSKKSKKSDSKKRKLADDADQEEPHLHPGADRKFIGAVLTELGYGKDITAFLEEAKLVTAMPSDLPDTIPALKKRLYQYMVDLAVVNDRIRADINLRTNYVEDAANLAARLSELEGLANE
ncbi:hypothetical protein FB45DRAFT_942233 [Roridomyces roridus]|uniref:Uncharacterized protein n=1 Tax=Roridomyces roridus TaxID=1738132 RepID=A0AAD7B6B4_9AGAR|nr:hypothetical protein FB45DRAFT_942233 [Roridomyces roridus]